MRDSTHFVSKDSVRRAIALLGIKPSDVHSCHRKSERVSNSEKPMACYKKGGMVTKVSIKIMPKTHKNPSESSCFKKGGPVYKMKAISSVKPMKTMKLEPAISSKIRKHEANSSKGYFKFLRDV